ncbi:extracellular solute-binding protein [Paenibacillus gansuensis]|uniref:Extracellular solute-binding protein n=1 Tax=Paenibacillus gansuensis TaxID=306542 RepID=A0ABW5PCP9_9BACL
MLRRKGMILSMMLLLSMILLTECHDQTNLQKSPVSRVKQATIPPSEDLSDQQAKKVLTIAVSLPPKAFSRLQTISGDYAMSRPQIEIRLVNLNRNKAGAELWEKAELGEAPDLMLLDNLDLLAFAASAHLKPVDSLLSNIPSSEGLDRSIEQVKWNGYLWGIPWDVDPYVLVWNRSSFLASGLHPEQFSGKWRSANEAVLRKNGLERMFVPYDDPYAVLSFMSAMDIPWREDGQWALTPEETEWDGTIEKVLRDGWGISGEDAWIQLAKGDPAIAIMPLSEYLEHAGEGLDFSVLSNQGNPSAGSWMKGQSFAVSTLSEQEEEAGRWIAAVADRFFVSAGPNAYKYLPASKYTYESAVFRRDPLYEKVSAAVRQSILPYQDPKSSAKLAVLKEEAAKLASGQTDFQRFLDAVNIRWSQLQR